MLLGVLGDNRFLLGSEMGKGEARISRGGFSKQPSNYLSPNLARHL